MRHGTLLFTLLAAALSLGTPRAANAVMLSIKDSADFNIKYEADALPLASQWTGNSGGTLNTGVAGATDGFTISMPAGSDNIYYNRLPLNNVFNPANGYTVEIRFKVINGSSNARGVFAFDAGDGGSGQWDAVQLNSTWLKRVTTTTPSDWQTLATGDFTDTFHTLRVAEEGNSAMTYYWLDGVKIAEGNYTDAYASLNRLLFGDGGSWITDGLVEMDYIRADTSGAYAPLPEPASLGLLATGLVGLAFGARRRRRRGFDGGSPRPFSPSTCAGGTPAASGGAKRFISTAEIRS